MDKLIGTRITFQLLANTTKKEKGEFELKKIAIILGLLVLIGLGVFIGFRMSATTHTENLLVQSQPIIPIENNSIPTLEVDAQQEKTVPSTLMIYQTYFTKCKHYVTEYEDINASLVNCTEEELQEKCKGWDITSFSRQEVELSREKEDFCNQHYQLQLDNKAIVVYHIDENGEKTEYMQTGITTEYLPQEDILKLETGILVYGKENLMSILEDYE